MSASNPSSDPSKVSIEAPFSDENSSSTEKIAPPVEGYLDREKLLKNMSNFGRTALGNSFAYLDLSLQGSGLIDISLIGNYKELQNLDLSYNNIKDLSVLSELKYLVSLNVSNNQVEKPFDFLTPYNLKEAWFSFNNIREIGNLSNYHYLQTLDLSHNKIEKIEGLEYCQRLRYLNLSNNSIVKIEGLNNLPIISLQLSGNRIKRIEGLSTLRLLNFLDLSSNNIRSLNGMPERAEFLEKIFLQDNKIQNIADLDYLVGLKMLRNLNLKSNPIREVENSRLIILFKIPHLEVLDGRKIDCHEKVNADDMFFPNVEYIASRDHMTNLVFSSIQDHKVKESTLPDVNSPYPILILCGAQGSGSQEMAIRLVKEFPEYFDFVPLHCTKKPLPNDKEKLFYRYLTTNEFDDDVLHGKFVCCNEYFGDWYGIKWESIESVAAQGLACVIHMELDALISFKKTYFEPRCVLVTTLDRNIQFERLKSNDFAEFECEVARTRADLYEEHNRDHPGFFDAVIITDNLNQGFITLKNLVLNYLGLSSIEQIYNSMLQNGESDSKNSSMHTNYTKSIDKKYHPSDLHKTDSFLPSNTATGNRSQMSHMSIESLSQMYSQSLRLKFGSAPAELFGKGEHAEKSIVRRIQEIKKLFESNNLVNSKSQIEKSLRGHGREDSMSLSSLGGGGRTSASTNKKPNKPDSRPKLDAGLTNKGYSQKKTTVIDTESDDDFID